MTAQTLINRIQQLCEQQGVSPAYVRVNYRYCNDSEVRDIRAVWEDLFDPQTNNILHSISLVTDPRQQ